MAVERLRQAIRMRDRHLLEEAVLAAEEGGVAAQTNLEMRKALRMLEIMQLRNSETTNDPHHEIM